MKGKKSFDILREMFLINNNVDIKKKSKEYEVVRLRALVNFTLKELTNLRPIDIKHFYNDVVGDKTNESVIFHSANRFPELCKTDKDLLNKFYDLTRRDRSIKSMTAKLKIIKEMDISKLNKIYDFVNDIFDEYVEQKIKSYEN